MRRVVVPAISSALARLNASRNARMVLAVAAAALMFVLVSALRTIDATGDPAGPLLVLPVALVALVTGRVGGLLAACVGLGLFVVQHAPQGPDLTTWTLLSGAAIFFLLAGVLGHLIARHSRPASRLR